MPMKSVRYEQVFEGLLRVTKKQKTVIFSMDELLDLLHDIDQEEGDFDIQEGLHL